MQGRVSKTYASRRPNTTPRASQQFQQIRQIGSLSSAFAVVQSIENQVPSVQNQKSSLSFDSRNEKEHNSDISLGKRDSRSNEKDGSVVGRKRRKSSADNSAR
jgi:hypothetical protein